MAITLLHPEPVCKGQSSAEGQFLAEGDGPRRREKQVVYGEDDGGYGVEADVGQQAQLELFGHNQLLIHRYEATVQSADQYLQGSGDDGKCVLVPKQSAGGGHIGEGSKDKRDGREEEADYGQILEVPTICFVTEIESSYLCYRGIGSRAYISVGKSISLGNMFSDLKIR